MALTGLLALLDDIAVLLDDVAVMTKVATQKTAGVLGDDLALNAEQVSGVRAERELPVVWAVAKGSAVNKAILVPLALGLTSLAPWAMTPLLLCGGAFLCFEGAEKLAHKALHRDAAGETPAERLAQRAAEAREQADPVALEKKKIRGAIRTDFVLSAEIVVIALGTASSANLAQRAGMLVAISAVMTVGVYGLVAVIVKLDDVGFALQRRESAAARGLARAILWTAPALMRSLAVLGTIAMFLVGGGIVTHSVPVLHALLERSAAATRGLPLLGALVPPLVNGLVGLLVGALLVALVEGGRALVARVRPAAVEAAPSGIHETSPERARHAARAEAPAPSSAPTTEP